MGNIKLFSFRNINTLKAENNKFSGEKECQYGYLTDKIKPIRPGIMATTLYVTLSLHSLTGTLLDSTEYFSAGLLLGYFSHFSPIAANFRVILTMKLFR